MEQTLEQKYQLIRLALKSETERNPIQIAKNVMAKDFINMHGPEHHFLDGASFLVAYHNSGGNIDIDRALDLLSQRARTMPGAMCGYWGVCGSTTSVGAALAIIHDVSPLNSTDYYKDDMEFTSSVIRTMSKIGGPRCCKRNAFISLKNAIDFVKNKYGIIMEDESIKCNFSSLNQQCIKERCPFYQAK